MAEVVDIATVPRLGAVELVPSNGVAGLAPPIAGPPKPENSDGGAAPFFSVVDAVGAVVVLAGGTPYENVGTVVVVALSFFSSGFPSLFAVAPKFPKSPPLAVVGAVVEVVPPKLKVGWG
jgi:hypothetical protein